MKECIEGKKINTEIRDKFELFEDLVNNKKIVVSNQILLKTKENNRFWLKGFSEVTHSKIDAPIYLVVEQSLREEKYGIKLKCSTLANSPFFRFDSGGPAHRNANELIPLNEQSILTPHFNTFNEKGQLIAYKTPQLSNEKESNAIVEDINFGLSHFCNVANMSLKNEDYPEVLEETPELALDLVIPTFNGAKFE